MKISVSITRADDGTVLQAQEAAYTSDEALGEVCGDLVAWARKSNLGARDIALTVSFLEDFPEPLPALE